MRIKDVWTLTLIYAVLTCGVALLCYAHGYDVGRFDCITGVGP